MLKEKNAITNSFSISIYTLQSIVAYNLWRAQYLYDNLIIFMPRKNIEAWNVDIYNYLLWYNKEQWMNFDELEYV